MAYVIGSQKGKDIAKNMKTGETYEASDGSTWTKKSDGSVSVTTSKGETFNNAYTPTSSGGSSNKSSGGNSQYTGSSNAVQVNTSYQQALKDEMNANSIAWWNADANEKQRLEQRNQEIAKILGGTVSYNPTTGTWSGSAGGFDADDIVDWEYDEPRPTAPTSDPRIDEMLDEILNRDSFSYDVMNDPLYKQYAEMYQREGDRATRNTLAEAAAGAGGMNSYAITAAQQANNYYNSQLNDVIPQLYDAAYQKYLTEINNKVRDLGLLQDMDATQYSRYRDTMNDWYNDKSFAYGLYQDAVNQNNWQTNFDYTDEWKNKEWNANQAEIQYNKDTYADETAKEDVRYWISLGVMPDLALIKSAGMDEATVRAAVEAVKAEMNKSGSKSNGNNPTYDPDKKKTQETNNPSWVAGLDDLGLGYIYDPELLVDLEEAGAIKAVNGKLVWADGWNAQNFQQKLIEKPKNSFFNSITTLF